MLRCVAEALSTKVRVVLEPERAELGSRLAQTFVPWNRISPASPRRANHA